MKPKGIGVDRYKALADQGHTAPETARMLGVSKATVQGMARRHGIVFTKGIAFRRGSRGADGLAQRGADRPSERVAND